MKTTIKTIGLLFGAALLLTACGQNHRNPPAELDYMPLGEISISRPEKVAHLDNSNSITDFLTDCESQFNRIGNSFSASIGQPHK